MAKYPARILMAALAMVSAVAAAAGETPAFDRQLRVATEPLRAATRYARSGNVGIAVFGIAEFTRRWAALAARHAAPSGPYAGDPKWRHALDRVTALAARSLAAAEAGDGKGAGQALAAIRRELAATRKRNNVVTFDDHVDDFGRRVRALSLARRGLQTLDATRINELKRLSEAVANSLERLAAGAPDSYAGDARFAELMDQGQASLARLMRALNGSDLRVIHVRIGEMRSIYGMIFLRYG